MEKFTKKAKLATVALWILSLLTIGAVAQTWSPPDLALDDLGIAANYIVKTDGSHYWATARNGTIVYESANLVAGVVQPCADTLTEGGVIEFASQRFAEAWECQLNITTPAITLAGTMGFHGKVCLEAKSTFISGQQMIAIYNTAPVTTIRDLAFNMSNEGQSIINIASSTLETYLMNLQLSYAGYHAVEDRGTYTLIERVRADYCQTYTYACGFDMLGSYSLLTGCSADANKFAGVYLNCDNGTVIGFRALSQIAGAANILVAAAKASVNYIAQSWNGSTRIATYP